MADDLSQEFDVIVLGTGMIECIFAAAAARIGKSVLHLDRNGFYGGDWASFNLDNLKSFIIEKKNDFENGKNTCNDIHEGEITLGCSDFKTITNIHEEIFVDQDDSIESDAVSDESEPEKQKSEEKNEDSEEQKNEEVKDISSDVKEENSSVEGTEDKVEKEVCEPAKEKWTWKKMMKSFRKFNLDISPKLLFSRGELVELLISSNVAKYAEYKCLTRILTYTDKLEQVPCSRSDVFSTKHISIIEKRMLMQLLNFCMNIDLESEEYSAIKDALFRDYLKKRKLSDNVCQYVIHAIAMVQPDATVEAGLIATKKFLKSLGRFGNTPFLWPMYGSGEVPQCFCRLCAVFGGIYCLRRNVESVIVDEDENCTGVVSEGKRFSCKFIVMDSTYAPLKFLPEDIEKKKVSRAILITESSLLPSAKEQISLLRIPPSASHNAINILELPPGSMVCPLGTNVVHAVSESRGASPKDDLEDTVKFFFNQTEENVENKPTLLYSLYFSVVDTTKHDLNKNSSKNMLITPNSGSSLDFDFSVSEAQKLFAIAFPDYEFLPRAPDPEEIILDSNDSEPQNNDENESQNPTNDESCEVETDPVESSPIIDEKCDVQVSDNKDEIDHDSTEILASTDKNSHSDDQ